jgi:hypothetical protein
VCALSRVIGTQSLGGGGVWCDEDEDERVGGGDVLDMPNSRGGGEDDPGVRTHPPCKPQAKKKSTEGTEQ